MMTKIVICTFDGICSLFREREEILKKMPIWINKYVTNTDNSLNPLDNQLFSYETSIYHSADLSQYPKLYDDISNKKNQGINYILIANVEQKYANRDFNHEITRGKMKITISNIEPKELTHATIASKNSDVNITIGN